MDCYARITTFMLLLTTTHTLINFTVFFFLFCIFSSKDNKACQKCNKNASRRKIISPNLVHNKKKVQPKGKPNAVRLREIKINQSTPLQAEPRALTLGISRALAFNDYAPPDSLTDWWWSSWWWFEERTIPRQTWRNRVENFASSASAFGASGCQGSLFAIQYTIGSFGWLLPSWGVVHPHSPAIVLFRCSRRISWSTWDRTSQRSRILDRSWDSSRSDVWTRRFLGAPDRKCGEW